MSELGVVLNKAVQIGIVVPSLENSTRILSQLFGIGPFKFIEWPNRPDSKFWFRNREENIRVRQGFVQAGGLELELIEPMDGERNAYHQFLQEHGGGIHHVLFEVDDLDATLAKLETDGVQVLQAGTGIRPGTRWVLLDTFELVGFLIELRHRAPGCDGTSIPETGI